MIRLSSTVSRRIDGTATYSVGLSLTSTVEARVKPAVGVRDDQVEQIIKAFLCEERGYILKAGEEIDGWEDTTYLGKHIESILTAEICWFTFRSQD